MPAPNQDKGRKQKIQVRQGKLNFTALEEVPDVAEVPDLSAIRDNSDLAEDDPCDPTTTSKPEAPMQSLNQLPVVTDLADARSANLLLEGGVLNTRRQRRFARVRE
jgi:hypothetical protein